MSEADKPEQALEARRQLLEIPDNALTPLLREQKERFLDDLAVLSWLLIIER